MFLIKDKLIVSIKLIILIQCYCFLLFDVTKGTAVPTQPVTSHLNNKKIIYKNDEYLIKFNKRTSNNHFDNIKLPDIEYLKTRRHTSSDRKIFEALDQFLSIWNLVLQDNKYQVAKDIPFTIIVPRIDIKQIDNEKLNDFIFEHIIPGISLKSLTDGELYGNINNNEIMFTKTMTTRDGEVVWLVNGGPRITDVEPISDKMSLIFVDGYIIDSKNINNNNFSKRNIQETNRYNEPQRLEMKNTTKHESLQNKDNKIGHLMNFLANMKTGTKVFQHFLTKSNISQILEDNSYTVLIPSDNAFQRWHPIDWGFYPFSVPEFTERILKNHFILSFAPIRMADIRNIDGEQSFKTYGGETVVFKNTPAPTVNNIPILSEFTLPNGNSIILISEVLFVSEAIVSRLHQMHKDKETPPLLAFPWFGAQFLSHSFLALEKDVRFTHISRYLNTAEIAPFVSGSNYTFFVPLDSAFEKLGFDTLPDNILASDKGIKMLLNHFVKGRLYDRDLKQNDVFDTLGGGAVKIQRLLPGNVTVNNAHIVETEVFVYNLGTMFYIDEILYDNILGDIATSTIKIDKTTIVNDMTTTGPGLANKVTPKNNLTLMTNSSGENLSTPDYTYKREAITISPNKHGYFDTKTSTVASDVEFVPSEFTEQSGTEDDFLLQDDEIITPRALPVNYKSPRK